MVSLLFISLFVLFLLSVPIAVSLGLATGLVVLNDDRFSMGVVVQQVFDSLNQFTLMAIPFFILAGYLMETSGISERLIKFSSTLVGHITGGLTMVAIVTSMFFAAISGSATATVAAIGVILIPAMIAKGYDTAYVSANQAVSGALGVIIPPSIPLILYAIAASVSVTDMFIAGILPGLLITVVLLITAYTVAKRRNYVGEDKSSFKEILTAFRKALLPLLMPFIVLGGIYGGIFTPTEAAVVAVAYSLFVGLFIYRTLNFKNLVEIFRKSAITTSIIMIVIGTAGLFSFILNLLGVPTLISNLFLEYTSSAIVFLILVNILLLIVGMFIETSAAILIFVPILLPIATELGVDPIHLGIIMVVNLAIGLITPPVGLNLFVAAQIANIKITTISRAAIPFILILFAVVMLISFVPFFSTWLLSFGK